MIWALIPAWLKRAMAGAVALITAIGGAWAIGRRGGRKAATAAIKAKADLDKARAIRQAKEIEDEVEALSPDALERRATKWLRKPTR